VVISGLASKSSTPPVPPPLQPIRRSTPWDTALRRRGCAPITGQTSCRRRGVLERRCWGPVLAATFVGMPGGLTIATKVDRGRRWRLESPQRRERCRKG
jgi:hypothetical protein